MSTKHIFALSLTLIALFGCADNHKLETSRLKDGQLINETINIEDLINSGAINNQYIDMVSFGRLDSIIFENNNPDESTHFSTPLALDLTKPVEKYSPEYYALYVCYQITKAINYYNTLFKGKLDFNSQEDNRSIEVVFGNVPLFTSPKNYIIRKNSNPSPSLFYHEMGHRAFWLIEDKLGINFHGLSVIHMGLLEYFTVSLNNSPLVGEGFLPEKLQRDASFLHKYPLNESYKLSHTFDLLKESSEKEMADSGSITSRYYQASMIHYGEILDHVIDNHRGGMLLTSTLWRIREQIGQEKTDKLVAETVMSLNDYMNMRPEFYIGEDDLPRKIWWYDVYYGLIHKDEELNDGENRAVIINEFKRAGYPIEKVELSAITDTIS